MKRRLLPCVDSDELPPKQKRQVLRLRSCAEDLLEENRAFEQLLARLCDEMAVLKGEKKRPVFKPSRMNEDAGPTDNATTEASAAKRPGSQKKSKTAKLRIDHERVITPVESIPPGSRFKGYRDFIVQDILITPSNTRYRLAHWLTPDGRHLTGRLPASLRGGHFGPELVSYILYQHHHCHVTQPLLHEQLREWGIDISAGQIDALLQNDKAPFHKEKDALLSTGLALSSYVTVDDTGARHQGNNGYVTHIGNEHFAWFQSGISKSRINFLEMLRAGRTDYRINPEALAFMKKQGLPKAFLEGLRSQEHVDFPDQKAWHGQMDVLNMRDKRHRKIATEGALLGSLKGTHIAENLAIISDDAGQFNVLMHGLCWVHAERHVHKMLHLNEQHRVDIASVRSQIWDFYADLKSYKVQPSHELRNALEKRFDTIFTQKTSYTSLNLLLTRLHNNKSDLLLVLERPEIPLHTNGSEGDIRDYVRKKKVSGGTRSDTGRQCRDTFASLKKTCRKLGISFWSYLIDRVSCSNHIPSLPHIVSQHINAGRVASATAY